MRVPFDQAGRIPSPGDNVAIAIRRLDAGTRIEFESRVWQVSSTLLEGHRFAIQSIPAGAPLLTWGLPFGLALRPLTPGEYVCNASILDALRGRHVDFPLPMAPNFRDYRIDFKLDERSFRPGAQVSPVSDGRTFEGYPREGGRGAGTRNCIAVIGTSSRAAGYARELARRFGDAPARYSQIDGVVPVAHTEGGGLHRPNNLEFVLRTLSGFMVHPNIGAVLAVDTGDEPVHNALLREYLRKHDYPIDAVPHAFLSSGDGFEAALAEGEKIIRGWLETVNGASRSPQPLDHLKVSLQCGGSDAFSGVSGNPLAGWVAREVIRRGGAANLAETDELIGAEPYVLANVRDLDTARAFLRLRDRFQERAGWHGASAEGNPSGGNRLRGLYNIVIKSIGAARKKPPEVRLDQVIEYGERMVRPGFHFMDSPGNDLESIAGQVASGCNLILFTTGNGSITNFPFVPTLKIMTHSGRFRLLSHEMDFNAGRYLEGVSMEKLGGEAFELALQTVSGQRSAGERTGQSQVQIWRDWPLQGPVTSGAPARPAPTGIPIPLFPGGGEMSAESNPGDPAPTRQSASRGRASDRIGLIVPTSLCAGQVARGIAEELQKRRGTTKDSPLARAERFVALPHTEGCGVSGGETEDLYFRTLSGYLRHPSVWRAVLLEHGCEKTHLDAFRDHLRELGENVDRFGWASIQLDGGLANVTRKVTDWFADQAGVESPSEERARGSDDLRAGFLVVGEPPAWLAEAFARAAEWIVRAGGTVVVHELSGLLRSPAFADRLFQVRPKEPTLAYGQSCTHSGFHIMESPTDHPVEALTGLGATGVGLVVTWAEGAPLQGSPFLATLSVGIGSSKHNDFDLLLEDRPAGPEAPSRALLKRMEEVMRGDRVPREWERGNVDFQITRGRTGFSL